MREERRDASNGNRRNSSIALPGAVVHSFAAASPPTPANGAILTAQTPSRPRIAVDLRALVPPPTGIGVYTEELLAELAARDEFELLGVAHAPLHDATRLRTLGIRLERQRSPLGVLWQQLVLPRRLAAGDVDLFWSPLHTLPRRLPVPAVVTVHDLALLHFPETLTWKIRWSLLPFLETSLERAARVVTVSHAVAAEIAASWPRAAAKVEVIWNGVAEAFVPGDRAAIAATRERLGLPDGYLLYVGTLEPRKNVELLLDAWLALRAEWPQAPPLVLAGPDGWHSAALRRRIEGLADAGVRRLGRLERAALVEVLQAAALFVYPSLYEGFGLPLVEAMACGVPVVGSNRASLPEVIGDAGLAVDADDPSALASALHQLLTDPELAARLAARGRERARLFSWRSAAARLAGLFHAVLAEREGARA